MEFKSYSYNQLQFGFKTLLTELNQLPISKTTAKYIDGIALTEINTQAILDQYNSDKAQELPNFKDYLKMGINLSSTMPKCPHTESQLKSIVDFVNLYLNVSQFSNNVPLISYSAKEKSFTINAAGHIALDRLVIRLTKKQADIFKQVSDLKTLLSKELSNDGTAMILNGNVYHNHMNTNNFKEEDLIKLIQRYC